MIEFIKIIALAVFGLILAPFFMAGVIILVFAAPFVAIGETAYEKIMVILGEH